MHVIKRRWKVLPPQYWMSGYIFEREVASGYYTPAFPIFNRPGIYYDRVYRYAWFEVGNGRAFVYDKQMFFYELNQLRVWQKYNQRQFEALEHVVKEKVATRQQREDWITYRNEREVRFVYLGSRRDRMRRLKDANR